MHVIREGRSGDGGSPHHKAHGGKKSNWHKMEDGKGKGSMKPSEKHEGKAHKDLDLKAPKRPLAVIDGGKGSHKGSEKKVKKGAYK